MDPNDQKSMAQAITSAEYGRVRWEPKPGDQGYLVLSDLRAALEQVHTSEKITVLDYGCGCSPYRALFPNADYRRADYLETETLDYLIKTGEPLPVGDGTFDIILSTQVLEHVEDPGAYLRECHRLLKTDGKLVLSTHGSFPDHGCPYDFQRWTVEGLERDLRKASFHKLHTIKLTTGPRALLFLFEHHFELLTGPKWTQVGFLLGLFRRLIRARKAEFHQWIDKTYPACRTTSSKDQCHHIYIGMLTIAQ